MDGRRSGTTLHITRPGSPAKQTLNDWWLPTEPQTMDSQAGSGVCVLYKVGCLVQFSLSQKCFCSLYNHVSLQSTYSSSTATLSSVAPVQKQQTIGNHEADGGPADSGFVSLQRPPILVWGDLQSAVQPPYWLHRLYSIRGEMNISTWAALEHVKQSQRCSR